MCLISIVHDVEVTAFLFLKTNHLNLSFPNPRVEMITDNQVANNMLKAELKEKVTYTLLRKHRHQTKKSNLRSLADIGKTVSSASRLFSNQENGNLNA